MVLLRRLLLVVLFIGAAVGGATFSNENEATVSIHYVFGTLPDVPLWIALLGSFTLGAALCLLAVVGRLTRASLAQRRYRKTVAKLEGEIHQLRNLPIDGEPAPAPQLPAPAKPAQGSKPPQQGAAPAVAGSSEPAADRGA